LAASRVASYEIAMGKNAIVLGCAAALVPLALALVPLEAACSSNSGPANKFTVGGHTCSQFDPGAPQCDGTPPNSSCTAPATACWSTVSVSGSAGTSGTAEAGAGGGDGGASTASGEGGAADYYGLCPACCTGNNASIASPKANCLYPIACTTQLECPFEAACVGGFCH
jgi:hypothetical protein